MQFYSPLAAIARLKLSGIGGKERPGIVHRLDQDTSGCLVAAKNDVEHRELSKQFTARTVEKIYLALVAGKLRKETGVIENKIGRHPVHRQRMTVSPPRPPPTLAPKVRPLNKSSKAR